MRKLNRVSLFLFPPLLALVGYAAYVYVLAGELKSIEPHFAGSCRAVEGVVGPEDIVILPDGRTALFSSNDERASRAGKPRPGAILAYDLTEAGAKPVNITPDADASFHPHGIGLHVDAGGAMRLFVVNHPGASGPGNTPSEHPHHTIESFDLVDGRLAHRTTISDDLLVSPNDVLAVGPDQFYVTNDHGRGSTFVRTLEEYLMLARANVLYYNGARFAVAAENLLYPNGISMSRGGSQVYVASSTGRKLVIFTRDPTTGALSEAGEVNLGTAPDNIDVDEEGNLWVGAHPKLLTFTYYAKDASRRSPSQVLKVTPRGGGRFSVDEIFLSDGSDISGSTVGARYDDRLLIGSVFDPHFLSCRMRP